MVEIKTTHKQYSVDRCESKSGTNKSMLFGEESYYNDAIVLCFILLGSAFFASTGRYLSIGTLLLQSGDTPYPAFPRGNRILVYTRTGTSTHTSYEYF